MATRRKNPPMLLYRGVPFGGKYSGEGRGLTDAGWYGRGEYWTDDRRVALHYAHGDTQGVMERKIHLKKPLYLTFTKAKQFADNFGTKNLSLEYWDRHDNADRLTRHFQELGYDGLIIDKGAVVVVFEPSRRKNPLSSIVYHKVYPNIAVDIVESDKLMTSPAYSAKADADINKGYLYFVSFMRSTQSGYRPGMESNQVFLQFDGRKLNQNYAGGPVDYWGRGYRLDSPHIFEMEDRLFTDKEWIPNVKKYLTAIHVGMVYEPKKKGGQSQLQIDRNWKNEVTTQMVEQLGVLEDYAAAANIPFYIYTKRASWRALRSPRHRTVSGWINAEAKRGRPFVESRSYERADGTFGPITPYDEPIMPLSRYKKQEFEDFVAVLHAVVAYQKGDKDAFIRLREGPHKEYLSTFSSYPVEQGRQLTNLVHNAKDKVDARPYLAQIRQGMVRLKKRTPETLAKAMGDILRTEEIERQKEERTRYQALERLSIQLLLETQNLDQALKLIQQKKKEGKTIIVDEFTGEPMTTSAVEQMLRGPMKHRLEFYGGYGGWLAETKKDLHSYPDLYPHLIPLFYSRSRGWINPKRRKNSNPTKSQVIDWFDRWKAIQWEPWIAQRAMEGEKHALIQALIGTAITKKWEMGFGYDRYSRYPAVLYVDTPVGQVSFHTDVTPQTKREACRELEKMRGKLRQVGVKGHGNVFCWGDPNPRNATFHGGPFPHYHKKWDESRKTPERIAELVSKGTIRWPFEIPSSTNPKRRKNPKFKIGDRVIEGGRKGKVTALHSPGTLDVLFDGKKYAIRRQVGNVRKR